MGFTYIILFGNHRNTMGLVLSTYHIGEEFQLQESYLTCRNLQSSSIRFQIEEPVILNHKLLSKTVTYRLHNQKSTSSVPIAFITMRSYIFSLYSCFCRLPQLASNLHEDRKYIACSLLYALPMV